MSKEKDFYIKLLKFCNNLKGDFTYPDLEKNIITNDYEKDILNVYLTNAVRNRQSLDMHTYSNHETIFWCTSRGGDPKTDSRYIMSYDAKFKYIDYQELSEARKMSRQALITSVIAIVIAIATLGASIFFSIKGLNHPTEINSQQFQEIKNLIKNNYPNE